MAILYTQHLSSLYSPSPSIGRGGRMAILYTQHLSSLYSPSPSIGRGGWGWGPFSRCLPFSGWRFFLEAEQSGTKQRGEDERDDAHQLDENVERRTRCIFKGITHRVAYDGRFVVV